MSIAYVSGLAWDTATACSLPILTAPFPGVNVDYILEQDFMVNAVSYFPLPLNTPHPDIIYANYKLVEEGPRRDVGGNVFRWTRKYAIVPQRYNQSSSISYQFIGYFSGGGTSSIIGRDRFTKTVAARIQYDYFLLDETSGDITDATGTVVVAGTPGVLPPLSSVPVLNAQAYYTAFVTSVWARSEDQAIGYGPTAATPQTNYPTPYASFDPITGTYFPPAEAYPTREIYEGWVKRTATVKIYEPNVSVAVAGVLTDTGLYEIVAQGSQCVRWLGNIIERQTTYIFPQ